MSKQALFEYVTSEYNIDVNLASDYDTVRYICDRFNIDKPDTLDTIDGSCLIILIKLIMKDND